MSGTRNPATGPKFISSLRWASARKPTIFNAIFNSSHRLNPITLGIINDAAHPRHFKLKRQYEEKDRNGLWWSPQVTLAISPKRTVRTWCTRRLRAAFKEELAARGLNELGQRVQNGKVVQGRAPIIGSLSIQANKNVITAEYTQVREEAGLLVESLLATTSKPQISSPSQRPAGGQRQGTRPPRPGRQTPGKGKPWRGKQ